MAGNDDLRVMMSEWAAQELTTLKEKYTVSRGYQKVESTVGKC